MTLFGNDDGARTRIKFCGMTRVDDVRLAGELGVDAIGLIFAARSPRRVDLGRALALREVAAPSLSVVALVMDNAAREIEAIVRELHPHVLQFHGSEDDAFCARFGIPFLKALPMRDAAADSVPALLARYPSAAGFVLDSHAPGAMGGSGARFDLKRLPQQHLARPWLLAGGLDESSVGAAIHVAHPWGVDVASGIEASDGIKDGAKMHGFVEAVQRAETEIHRQDPRKPNEQR